MKIIIVPGLTETVQIQLWTPSSSAPSTSDGRRKFVLHETPPVKVDYGVNTNKLLAVQNRRTRTEKIRSAS
jgi:hypothetical protein